MYSLKETATKTLRPTEPEVLLARVLHGRNVEPQWSDSSSVDVAAEEEIAACEKMWIWKTTLISIAEMWEHWLYLLVNLPLFVSTRGERENSGGGIKKISFFAFLAMLSPTLTILLLSWRKETRVFSKRLK